jgi:hypothetical protein
MPPALRATPVRSLFLSGPTRFAFLAFSCIVLSGLTAAFAQDAPKPSASAPSDQAAKPAQKSPPSGLYDTLQEKSIFFPDIASSTERLTPGKKFQLFVDNSISLNAIGTAALASAISQADNSPTGYGQGWEAYAKRFGSFMGRQASSEFFGTFILASALHQDPRFYPEAKPTFGHAMKYSVQRIFVTRNDDGHDVANWSGLAGPLMAEGLANVYWPDRNRSVGDTFLRYGIDLAARAGTNLLRDYWPVLYGKVRHTRPSGGEN